MPKEIIKEKDLESAVREFNKFKTKLRVSITSSCNLTCAFCHKEGLDDYSSSPRMSVENFTDIIAAYVSIGGKVINITGGEPLLHPNIKEMIRMVGQYEGIYISMPTNGLLLDTVDLNPRTEPISETNISFHTQNDDLARRLLGRRYNVDQVLGNIEKHLIKGYRTTINLTLTKENAPELEAIMNFAVRLGCNMKVIDLGRTDRNAWFYDQNYVDPKVADLMAGRYGSERKILRTRAGNFLIQHTLPQGNHILIKDVSQGKHETDMCDRCPVYDSCSEGVFALRVNPNGIYQPCILRVEYNLVPAEYEGVKDQKQLMKFAIYKMMRGIKGKIELKK